MSSLRLAPHFALVGCVSAAIVLAAVQPLSLASYAMAAAYVAWLALVGRYARPKGWWWYGLLAANVALLFGVCDTPYLENRVLVGLLYGFGYSLVGALFFGAFVQASVEAHEARDRSLAAAAERRFVLMASVIPLDYVAVIYGTLAHAAWLRVAVVGSVVTKLLYLLLNEWTVRQIRGTPTSGLRESRQRPSPDVKQIDLGIGDAVRLQHDDAASYRQAPQATLAVVGSVEESARLVRRSSKRYVGMVVCMWTVLAFVAYEFLVATR